jgi:Ca-activated chloride channel homolog
MKILFLILFSLILTASALNDPRKANEAFERGDYEQAAELYRQSIEQNPDDARLWFNLGNALAHAGLQDDAQQAYEEFRNRASTPQEQALADYNQGRLFSDLEEYEQALESYRNALRKNPDDEDARHNYELALRHQQQQQDQQQQQQPDPESGDEDQDGDSEQEPQQQPEGDQQQDDGQQQPDSPQDGDRDDLRSPEEMSREQAENLLDALEQIERELLENRKKESSQENRRNDKDW